MALTKPFAENGNKSPIPTDASPDGSVSYDQGFGSFYALPPEEGGKFIDRAQFNQLMYDTTSQVLTNKGNIATIQGDLATAQLNITTLQQKTSSLENSVSTLESQATTGVGYLTQNISYNIGADGDYTTIADALRAISQYNTITDKQITLNLQANYAGGEDLTRFRGDYSFVTINGNNQNFNFATFFIKVTAIIINITSINIVGAAGETPIQIFSCPQIVLDNVKINAGIYDAVYMRDSRLKIMGVCDFATAAAGINVHGGQTEIFATTTYSAGVHDINLYGGAIVYSFSPASSNIAKNTLTRNGIFFN